MIQIKWVLVKRVLFEIKSYYAKARNNNKLMKN